MAEIAEPTPLAEVPSSGFRVPVSEIHALVVWGVATLFFVVADAAVELTLLAPPQTALDRVAQRAALMFVLHIPVLCCAVAYLAPYAVSALDGLRPVLPVDDAAFDSLRDRLLRAPLRVLVGLVAAGALLGVLVCEIFGEIVTRVASGQITPRETWSALLCTLNFAVAVPVASFGLMLGDRFRRIGQLAEIELFEPERLAPFARVALRIAFFAVLSLSVSTLATGFPSESPIETAGRVAVRSLVAALGCLFLLLPMLGAHQRIRQVKHREIARVAAALRSTAPERAEDAPQRTSLLLTLRAVQDAREWPLDPPGVRRFLLFLLIPAGSWIGGALVERFVQRLLG